MTPSFGTYLSHENHYKRMALLIKWIVFIFVSIFVYIKLV